MSRIEHTENAEVQKEDLIETLLPITLEDDKIEYEQKSIFEAPKEQAIVHCVSADLQVENGIAKEISNKYGGTSSLKRHKKKVGTCLVRQNRCTLFYLITKKHYTDAPSYIHFEQCLLSLKEKCHEYKIKTLAFPKYGGRFR